MSNARKMTDKISSKNYLSISNLFNHANRYVIFLLSKFGEIIKINHLNQRISIIQTTKISKYYISKDNFYSQNICKFLYQYA